MTDVELTAESFTVHAREKISTGDYENAEFHVTIEGGVDHSERVAAGDAASGVDEQTRRCLKAKLLSLHKDAQETVERACENRVKADGHEDWGVHNGVGDGE